MHNQPVRFRSIKARPNDAINEIGSKTWLSADEWSNNNNKFSEHRIAPATDTHISKLLSSLSCRYTLHLSYYNTACSKLNLKLLKLSSRLHTTTSRTSGYPQTEKKLAHNTDCLRFTCSQQRRGRCKWSSAGTSKKVKEKKTMRLPRGRKVTVKSISMQGHVAFTSLVLLLLLQLLMSLTMSMSLMLLLPLPLPMRQRMAVHACSIIWFKFKIFHPEESASVCVCMCACLLLKKRLKES